MSVFPTYEMALPFRETLRGARPPERVIPTRDLTHGIPDERCVIDGHCTDILVAIVGQSFSLRSHSSVLASASTRLASIVQKAMQKHLPLYVKARYQESLLTVIQWIYTRWTEGRIMKRKPSPEVMVDAYMIAKAWHLDHMTTSILSHLSLLVKSADLIKAFHLVLAPNDASQDRELRKVFAVHLANREFQADCRDLTLKNLAHKDPAMLELVVHETYDRVQTSRFCLNDREKYRQINTQVRELLPVELRQLVESTRGILLPFKTFASGGAMSCSPKIVDDKSRGLPVLVDVPMFGSDLD